MEWRARQSALSVALLAGGDSHQRRQSLATGEHVAAALKSAGHSVERFDPADVDVGHVPWSRFDACFVAVPGALGEDGRLQRRLLELEVPYTGSGPVASRLGMSKSASKERFLQAGVPTPRYVLFHASESIREVAAHMARLRYPLVIKPDSQGSSLGVGFVQSADELPERVADAQRYDPFMLAETWIDGREFTVAVMGRRVLPVIELGTPRGALAHWTHREPLLGEARFDTGLPPSTLARLQNLALAAATALATTGLVTVDLMLDVQAQPWVLEVNTVPHLAPRSLAALAAGRAGIELPALCDWMVREAVGAAVRLKPR